VIVDRDPAAFVGHDADRLEADVGRRLARSVAADRVLDEADIAWPVAAETSL
jgi:hypothetical protein